jgi:diguanylate cyclase (GGDEF)-like protein/PAS domain S-box-containing protein
MSLQQAAIDLAQESRRVEAERLLGERAIPAQETVTQLLRELLAREVEMIRKHSELSSRRLQQLGQIIWAVTGVVMFLSVLIGAFVSRRLSALIDRLRSSSADLRAAVLGLEYQKFALDQHAIVSIADASGAISYVNDKFCEISRYARAELLGENHRLLRSGAHALEFYESMWTTIMGGQVWKGDICNRNKDGGLYWVATTIVPFMDDAELPYQYVSIRTDITHVKAVEEDLLRNASQLEQQVADRTAALALANRELEIEVRQRRELEEHLNTLASTDTLTEIFNRRKFDAVLAAELDRAVRYGQTFSLILFDIDHFKQVNDRFGHPAGDGVLSALAKVVTSATRASDVFARWGGEEFVVLAPNNAGAQSRLLAEKLRAIVACQEFPVVGHVTCSFGVTSYTQGDDADTLLRRVDEALYRAKLGGRNRVEVV